MIPIPNPIPKPRGFDAACANPGKKWLKDNPVPAPPAKPKRPKDLWSRFRPALATGFGDRCGYGAMWISSGTVDHFVSCHEDRTRAYEWSNYRYVEGWINGSKSKKLSTQVLDPLEVQDGWFEIELPSLQLKITAAVPAAFRDRAEFTLKHLHLRDDERIVRQRREWLKMYEQGTPLAIIEEKAPLIARAIRKAEGPNPGSLRTTAGQ